MKYIWNKFDTYLVPICCKYLDNSSNMASKIHKQHFASAVGELKAIHPYINIFYVHDSGLYIAHLNMQHKCSISIEFAEGDFSAILIYEDANGENKYAFVGFEALIDCFNLANKLTDKEFDDMYERLIDRIENADWSDSIFSEELFDNIDKDTLKKNIEKYLGVPVTIDIKLTDLVYGNVSLETYSEGASLYAFGHIYYDAPLTKRNDKYIGDPYFELTFFTGYVGRKQVKDIPNRYDFNKQEWSVVS